MCWFGDGATSEGAVHEAMNLAGVHKLPVVFLCENNGYAISVPLAQQMPITSMEERAVGLRLRRRVSRRLRCRGGLCHLGHGDRPGPLRRRPDADRPPRSPHHASLLAGRRVVPRRRSEGGGRPPRPDPEVACPSRGARSARRRGGRSRSQDDRGRRPRRERGRVPPTRTGGRTCPALALRRWLSSASSRRSARHSTRRWLAIPTSCCSARTSGARAASSGDSKGLLDAVRPAARARHARIGGSRSPAPPSAPR